jgi:hypothetical protein
MEREAELTIMALQQRIGELVSNYEMQIALLRVELTKFQESIDKQKAADEYSQSLSEITTQANA